MIHKWHIIISGFTQSIKEENGMDKLWLKMRPHAGQLVTLIPPQKWNADFAALAEFIERMKPEEEPGRSRQTRINWWLERLLSSANRWPGQDTRISERFFQEDKPRGWHPFKYLVFVSYYTMACMANLQCRTLPTAVDPSQTVVTLIAQGCQLMLLPLVGHMLL